MKTDKIASFVEEYESEQNTYQAFAVTVKAILEILLQNNGLKYQITARAKSPESLHKKLSEGNLPPLNSVIDVQDLAACRVLFYLETDIERFARYLYDEFEVLRRDDRYSRTDYNAVHLVVKLRDNRTALSEYAQFSGMICEIQLTTILYHAWSEMAHDIIYKPPSDLPQFDIHAYDSLRNRFKAVMEDHIKQASYEFEFIYKEFEKIKEGRRIFDLDFLTRVERSNSINEIYENLQLLAQYVKEFGDKTPKELKIIDLITKVLTKSSTLKREPIKTAIGELEGYDFTGMTKVCLEILDTLRYQYPEETFDICVQLSKADDPEVRTRALAGAKRLTQYDFHVLKQVGYAFQRLVLDKIERWRESQLLDNLDIVLTLGEDVLEASFQGTSWQDYKTINFTSGALVVTEELGEIRAKTIEVLRKVLNLSKDQVAKQRILRALNEAVRTPHQGTSPELDELILKDSNMVMDIYIAIAADREINGHILGFIEEQMHWLVHRFGAENLPNIEKLKSILAANEEYQMFRILVGYDGRFAPEFDFEKDHAERVTKIQEFLSEIISETFPLWTHRILTIMESYDDADPGKYQYFHDFLRRLSEREPALALCFLKEHEENLRPVLLSVVSGVWQSPQKDDVKETLAQWIGQGKYLADCARVFAWVKEIDDGLLELILGKAVQMGDARALNCLIDSIAENYAGYRAAPSVLVKIIQQLTNHHNTQWINYVWFRKQSIIPALSEAETDIILENLLELPSVDYHAESILKWIADKYPLKMIDWFHARIAVELKEKKPLLARSYDAVPFELRLLRNPLIKHENEIIRAVFKWYGDGGEENNWRYRLEASRFLRIIFPDVGETLERFLLATIEDNESEALDDVLCLLREYEGENFLWTVCKTIIAKTATDQEYPEIRSELLTALSRIGGVVRGEYGLAEAYEKKRENAKTWPDDNIPVVKAFLKEYGAYLGKLASHARKKAEEDLELRKREFE
jgi:ppGpp synthetase/RelA/SpoT-type nucleotidyltranferase